jgi:adenylate cyclase
MAKAVWVLASRGGDSKLRSPPELIARFRYELLALAVFGLCAGLHLFSDFVSPVAAEGRLLARGIQLLELRSTDLKFRFREKEPPHADVVVAAIDEWGAQKYGLWPWKRSVIAEGISKLVDLDAKAIGLDLSFTDASADESATFRALLDEIDTIDLPPDERLAHVRSVLAEKSTASPDAALKAALEKAGPRLVQGVIPLDEETTRQFTSEKLTEQLAIVDRYLIKRIPKGTAFHDKTVDEIAGWSASMVQTPLAQFAPGTMHLGHIGAVLDADGTIRRVAPLLKLTAAHGLVPSLGTQAAAVYLDAQVVPLVRDTQQVGVLLKGERERVEIPFQNNEPFAPIRYPGPAADFLTISLRDVIEGKVDAARIRGKVVLIGVTVVGSSGDQRVTPFSQIEPGVYTHAAFVSNILSRRFLERYDWLVFAELGAMLVLSLLLARLVPRFESFRVKALFIVLGVMLYVGADVAAFARGVQLATVVPLFSILTTSFGLVFLGYASESQEKRAQRKTFERYLGADVLEEALLRPEKLDRGEKRELTVLFSDIRGFTTLSEAMLPDKLARFINDYLSPMTRIVFEEKGTLDKYIGDALMAFWNAPLDQSDHAMRACRAAMAMLQKLESLKPGWKREGLPEIDIGIGINTGPMIVGNMGSDVRVDYTVMGDAVNLASRLEGTNKEYETRVILGEATYEQVKGQVVARRLGAVRVKGKHKPVDIYELRGIGPPAEADARAIAAFEAGLLAYAQQQWEPAATAFGHVQSLWPADPPSRRYLEEIERFKKNPPGPGWDGVYTATHK